MKMFMLICLSVVCILPASAQLKTKPTCPELLVDVLDGKVNGVRPDFTADRVKVLLPCFTSSVPEGDSSKCGSNVFYKDQDIYFYTGRDYIQIGPKFKGKFTIPIMGATRKSLFNWLGNAKLKDDTWEAYQTSYGCLVLHFDAASKVNMIQFSTFGTETIQLCE
jgi:hypothetical protein